MIFAFLFMLFFYFPHTHQIRKQNVILKNKTLHSVYLSQLFIPWSLVFVSEHVMVQALDAALLLSAVTSRKSSYRQHQVATTEEMGWEEKTSFQDVSPWHALSLFSVCFLCSEN